MYELESRKPRISIIRPFQVWGAEFCFVFLDRYLDRRDFVLNQMDTDSNYMIVSGGLEEIVRPELRCKFEAKKKE